MGLMDIYCNLKTATGKEKQQTMNDAYKKKAREKVCEDIARWMYEAAIPFNVVNLESFKVALDSIGRYGIGLKPPSYYEVRVPLLKKEVQNTNDVMKSHKVEWERYGCSIMSDGWTDRSNRSLINFLVNSSKGSMFIDSVDASSYSHTGDELYKLLSRMVQKVGEANVIQIITNNAANYALVGYHLEAEYPYLYWTPCAAHCVDLMLEDIGKIPTIAKTIKRAIELNGYIYNRCGLLNMMRRYTGLKNLLRPAKTRFATAFITLSSIYKQQDNLRKMFVSDDWTSSKWAKEQAGKKAAQSVLADSFWAGIIYALKVTGPLVRVLRLVDGENKPAMGYIYEAMDRAKEAIAASFNDNEKHKYELIYSIIDKRWDCQLHRPLHAAGYYLNP
ncbi:HAT transposon superfamily protein [Quillaja saponaria]|uniref:HAT transposon superfamily protein n=1 Tax=Quillaja saponaria TaxID=32244 RepID=A0AAD7VIR2_QUISA|nr:HAT transposon superfamily protein [Quillaja saponaria]